MFESCVTMKHKQKLQHLELEPANVQICHSLKKMCISKILLNAEYSVICHNLISTSLDTEQAVLASNACTAIGVSSMFLRNSQQEMAQWCPKSLTRNKLHDFRLPLQH
jgi:hypothetical protein